MSARAGCACMLLPNINASVHVYNKIKTTCALFNAVTYDGTFSSFDKICGDTLLCRGIRSPKVSHTITSLNVHPWPSNLKMTNSAFDPCAPNSAFNYVIVLMWIVWARLKTTGSKPPAGAVTNFVFVIFLLLLLLLLLGVAMGWEQQSYGFH